MCVDHTSIHQPLQTHVQAMCVWICGFEADRDVIGKLISRKRALKMLGIKVIPGGVLASLTAPQMTDVNPNRWVNR